MDKQKKLKLYLYRTHTPGASGLLIIAAKSAADSDKIRARDTLHEGLSLGRELLGYAKPGILRGVVEDTILAEV